MSENNINQKGRWYSIFIAICLYILSTAVPYKLWINDSNILFWLNFATRALFLIIILIYLKRNELLTFNISKIKTRDLLYFPLILLCFSNMFVAWYEGSLINNPLNYSTIFEGILMCLIVGFSEELLFRQVLLNEFRKKFKDELAILFSSLIFGAMHLVAISSLESIPFVLAQCGYSIILGIVVGFIYVKSNNFIYAAIYHFLFNFLNNILFTFLYTVQISPTYYIVNVIVGLVVLAYEIAIYFLLREKNDVS